MSDDLLLARVAAGDDRALARVYDEHAAAVLSVARRVTCNDQLAVDVTQDVFVYLWQWPSRVDLTRGSLRTYLRMIAHRRAVDAVRRSERRVHAEARTATSPCGTATTSAEDSVADDAAARWCGAVLAGAVALLPDEQREVLHLTYVEGRTMTEVAAMLGIPVGTVKSRVRLGVARVRALVGNDLEAGR